MGPDDCAIALHHIYIHECMAMTVINARLNTFLSLLLPAMPRRTKEDAEITRQTILDAAEDVFQKQGVANTTLNDIARQAGVTRGAIYWHFDNKLDLFKQMYNRFHLPIQALAEQSASAAESDPLGSYRSLLVLLFRQTVRDPHQRKVLDILLLRCEQTEAMGEIVELQTRYYLEAVARTQKTLENAIRRKQLPSTLDTRRASVLLHATIRGLLTNWLLAPEAFKLDEDAEILVDAALDTLRHTPALQHRH